MIRLYFGKCTKWRLVERGELDFFLRQQEQIFQLAVSLCDWRAHHVVERIGLGKMVGMESRAIGRVVVQTGSGPHID